MPKVKLYNVRSDAWLKEFKKAMDCPSFRFTPYPKDRRQNVDPEATDKYSKNLREAQKIKKNY
jgi:hypothetical protein